MVIRVIARLLYGVRRCRQFWMRWTMYFARRALQNDLGRTLTFVVGALTMAAAFRWLDDSPSFATATGIGGALVGVSGMARWLRRVKFPGAELDMVKSSDRAEQYREMVGQRDAGVLSITEAEQTDTTRQLVAEKAAQALFEDAAEDYFEGCQFRFFMYSDRQQKLIAVLRPDAVQAEQRGWRPGEGVTGVAYQSGIYQIAQGDKTHDGTFGLDSERQERYRHLTEVAAMPVVNANDRLIGVLSVSHSQDRVILGTDEGYRKHAAIASSMARIVVDLLGWRTDEPPATSS
ncbi:MAG: GAF domain-containing protein [bacterium]|nr:GAF domain-containing protein [bacterium]